MSKTLLLALFAAVIFSSASSLAAPAELCYCLLKRHPSDYHSVSFDLMRRVNGKDEKYGSLNGYSRNRPNVANMCWQFLNEDKSAGRCKAIHGGDGIY